MEKVIICNNIKKTYSMGKEHVDALKGINLEIKKGEFCALLGKSGSGKSTLLNMIAGLEPPTEGEIIFKNNHLESMNETQITRVRKKYVGFIFQSYNLLTSHTALENVMLPMIFNDVPKKERIERAKYMLDAVGIGDRVDHKPHQMSGGQQQRVSIARAFVNNPEIIFADEPTGNLDTKTTNEVMDLMLKIVQKNNQTLVMVTHDSETAEYAHTIIHMKDGLIDNIKDNNKWRNKDEKAI